MKIHLLDMGRQKYGDCLLVTQGEHTMLIDGGHPGDAASILRQLTLLLQKRPPFIIDLMVITHCHADHIGCLPDLIKMGDIVPRMAFVADEKLGWGRMDQDAPMDTGKNDLADNKRTLVLALQEEDRSDLSDEELEQFLFDVASLEDKYTEMLQKMESSGVTKVVRFGSHTDEDLTAVHIAGAPFKLAIIGPTLDHLAICATTIAQGLGEGRDNFLDDISTDTPISTLSEKYRNLAAQFQRDTVVRFSEDRPGIGAAKNNQSIVISVEAPEEEGNWKALLAGDMQFAKAEVKGLNSIMVELLAKINDKGPYDFIKLTHHCSYNGTNTALLSEWNKDTKFFAHSGGWKDASHPDSSVLRILEEKANAKALLFARNDHNGMITFSKVEGELGFDWAKGELNDFTLNEVVDQKPEIVPQLIPELPAMAIVPPEAETPTSDDTTGFVEVIAKVPHTQTKVVLTIEVEPLKKKPHDVAIPPLNKFSETDRLAGLLFITNWATLGKNITQAAVEEVKNKLKVGGATSFDIPSLALQSAASAALAVRQRLSSDKFQGVVILGGYDVVPSQILDVLPPALRKELKFRNQYGYGSDSDDFIVWSDDVYGDTNGDGDPELPVSRIPDGKDSQLIQQCLSVPRFSIKTRFGIRNLARPFAHTVYQHIPGEMNSLEISESFAPQHVEPDSAKGAVYYMLHGSDRDGTRFWGETANEEEFEAFTIENIPSDTLGTVVFTGCCWGALCAEPRANRKATSVSLRPRTPDQSIALRYLQTGALAFVGCTGSHYSPRKEPYNYHGKPMHDSFWQGIKAGKTPAQALFDAKNEYKKAFPHGETTPYSKAIELKILRQFTVLGLGW